MAMDASAIVPLRLMRIAAGGAKAQTEIMRMVGEKALALCEAQLAVVLAAAAGRGPRATRAAAMRPYRRRLRANRRRLTAAPRRKS